MKHTGRSPDYQGEPVRLLLLLIPMLLTAAWERGLKPKEIRTMQTEQRLALVIGNSEYQGRLAKLKNPVNDARLMKETLESLGFEVLFGADVTKTEFKKMIKRFSTRLSKGGVGLFYYAGHGIQVDGRNFLIASDSRIREKDDVEFESIAMDYVVKKIQGAHNRFNVVVLDACRNDPFSRSSGGGLAPLQNARGIFVGYATEAGNVALDGSSDNSVFTAQLSHHMKRPIPIEEVFKNTRAAVWEASNHEQFPGVYNQALGEFYFTLPKVNPRAVAMKTATNVEPANAEPVAVAAPVARNASESKGDEGISSAWYWGGGAALLLGGAAAAAAGGGGGGDDGGDAGTPTVASDPVITLTWNGENDLDLIVEDPCGKRIAAYNTSAECTAESVTGKGELTQTSNETSIDGTPTEVVTFASQGGAPGTYYVYVSHTLNRDGSDRTDFTLTVTNNGATGVVEGDVGSGNLLPAMQFTH